MIKKNDKIYHSVHQPVELTAHHMLKVSHIKVFTNVFETKSASRDFAKPNCCFKQVANMNPSPNPFDLSKGKTYKSTGANGFESFAIDLELK